MRYSAEPANRCHAVVHYYHPDRQDRRYRVNDPALIEGLLRAESARAFFGFSEEVPPCRQR